MLKGKGSTRQDRRPHEDSDALGQSPSGTKQQSAAELSADAVRKLSILGKMTGGIVHDFRNILAVIDSGLRLAENSCNDPKAARNFITGAREGIARGLALTSQLLTFATQREFQARAADPNELLKALELFLRYGAGSEVRVILELSPKIPNCLVDPSQFNAAIVNLVINARDAMPHGGEIQISTVPWGVRDEVWEAKSDYYVRVRVRDNGLGMADEVLQKIFQPFFTTKGENGTGLGVPQVGALMRDIGGHICVASDPGRGTTFDLYFPAVEPNGGRARSLEVDVTKSGRSVSELSAGRLLSMTELPVL